MLVIWTNVEDNLPPFNGEEVLVTLWVRDSDKRWVETATPQRQDDGEFRFYSEMGDVSYRLRNANDELVRDCSPVCVTHWAELPEPAIDF